MAQPQDGSPSGDGATRKRGKGRRMSLRDTTFIVNKKAGFFSRTEDGGRRFSEAVNRFFPDARIVWIGGEKGPEAIEAAIRETERVVVGCGGDGTIHLLANSLARHLRQGRDLALGALPMGTFNLIAQDLGMPLEIEDAVRALSRARTRRIDVGDMNGRIFLHNVSIGMHRITVETRERVQRELGMGKKAAAAYALFRTWLRPPLISGRFQSLQRSLEIRSPAIFVGVNRHDTRFFSMLRRQSLDDGFLTLFYVKEVKPLRMLKLAAQVLVGGRMGQIGAIESHWIRESFTIQGRKHRLKLVADGELLREPPPLVFRPRRHFLKALVADGAP